MMNHLAVNLRILRNKRKMSQAQLAEALHLGERVVSHYENGNRVPDADLIVAFADFFGVTTDYLLRENEETIIYRNAIKRFKEEHNDSTVLSMVENSELWKKYVKHKEEKEKLFEDHREDFGWQDNYNLGEEYDWMERRNKASERAYLGDYSGAVEIYEELLSDGDTSAFSPLVALYKETEFSKDTDAFFDELSIKESNLELAEKILTCGAIVYKELKSELDFIYDICEGRFKFEN